MLDETEIASLLERAYDKPAPPPEEFHAALLNRMGAEITSPHRMRRWIGAAIAAASVAAMVAVGTHFRSRGTDSSVAWQEIRHESAATTAPATGESEKLSRRRAPAVVSLGMLSLVSELSQAPLIVRARIDGWTGSLVHYTILRTIYGQLDEKTIDLDIAYGDRFVLKSFQDAAREKLTKEQGRAPSEEELLTAMMAEHGMVKGHEVVMLLAPGPGGYASRGTFFDVPPEHPLEKVEGEMVDVIESSAYLEPQCQPGVSDVYKQQTRGRQAIVRATLVSVDGDAATWKVTKKLEGVLNADAVVIVSHDLYRQRAQTIAAHAALKDPTLADPKAMEARVHSEMDRLIQRELTPNRAAILILGDLQTRRAGTSGKILARSLESADGKHLDEIERQIGDDNHDVRL